MTHLQRNLCLTLIFLLSCAGFPMPSFAAAAVTDSFGGASIDTSVWSVQQSTAGNVAQNNALSITGNNAWGTNGISTISTFDRSSHDLSMTTTVTLTSCASAGAANMGYGNFSVFANPGDSYLFSVSNGTPTLFYLHNGSIVESKGASGVSCAVGTPLTVTLVVRSAGGADLYLNGAATPNASTSLGTFTGKSFYLQNYSSSRSIFSNATVVSSITAPDAPVSVSAEAGNGQATVSFTEPAFNGGLSISSYTVTSSPGNLSVTGASSPLTVTGLSNGTSYTFTVTATNAVGTSVASAVSNSVSPTSTIFTPSAPTRLSGLPANGRVILSWTAPSTTGGAAITDYDIQYRRTGDASWSTWSHTAFTETTATVNGLDNGTFYDFRVAGVNSAGIGTFSSTFSSKPTYVLLSDSFGDTSIDTALWTVHQSITDNVVQNGTLAVTGNGAWGANGVETVSSFDRSGGDLSLTTVVTPSSCGAVASAAFGYGNFNILANPGRSYIFSIYNGLPTVFYFSSGALVSSTAATGYTCAANVPFTATLTVKQAGGLDLFLNGASSPNATLSGGTFTNKAFYLQQFSAVPSIYSSFRIGSAAAPAAPSAPASLVATPRSGAVFLQWVDAVAAVDHVISYKLTSSGVWNTFSHAESAAQGIVVTGLVNGMSYDFKVATFTDRGTSAASSITSATPAEGNGTVDYHQILSTGQSLAIGYGGGPSLSTSQPYANLMLNAGKTALIPLVEPATAAMSGVESMSSGLANMLSNLESAYTSIVSLHGVSATAYAGLKKGTAPYAAGMAQASGALKLSLQAGKSFIVPAVTAIHGESDELEGATADQYEADLVEWQRDYQEDIQALTGQAEAVPFFTDQMSSWTAYSTAVPHTALGQYQAAKDHPDTLVVVAPKYMLDYSDNVHLTNYSYRRLGEYYGKVMKKVLVDRQAWVPLIPASVTRTDNIITARFSVPVRPLRFDTVAVDAQANKGFEYSDGSSSAVITNVEIAAPDTVRITLSATPTGANQRLRYAYTGTSGAGAGAHIAGSARGNLRDSDGTLALYQDASVPAAMGNTLSNWALSFDEPVVRVDPPAASSVTDGTSGGGGGRRSGTPTATPPEQQASSQPTSVPSVSPAEPSGTFLDVPAHAWFSSYVDTLVREGILSGYQDAQGRSLHLFKPAQSVTIAEMLKMGLLAAGRDVAANGVPDNASAQNDWSARYVAAAEAMDLPLLRSRPSVQRSATRGEVIDALLRFFRIPLQTASADLYHDLSPSSPYADAIATATALGIIQGDTTADGTLARTVRPFAPINRAEIAKMIVLLRLRSANPLP